MKTGALTRRWNSGAEGDCRIVVNSIGDAGIPLMEALKQISPLPEPRLIALLYQAPSELAGGLSRETADEINRFLLSHGLDSAVIGMDDPFEEGDDDHEVALVVKDISRMAGIGRLVMEVLGIDVIKAREILCASPAVLMGKISANTAAAFRRRFQALGAELDVSRPSSALYDVFLVDPSPEGREAVSRFMAEQGVTEPAGEGVDDGQPLLAAGLSNKDISAAWNEMVRRNLPVRIINRDFERFDLRMEACPVDEKMVDFLVKTTPMPEAVARKIPEHTPIVTHENIRFAQLDAYLEMIHHLGGRASGHLLSFQTFSLALEKIGNRDETARLLQGLGRLSEEETRKVLDVARMAEGPFTSLQARWLKWEMKGAGTEAEMVLR